MMFRYIDWYGGPAYRWYSVEYTYDESSKMRNYECMGMIAIF